ncbi:MAG: hypothetical protein K1X89_01955 [Myxococcaceae bacterium]|nr:hypothetical protein [Myxococcaceae bacterium]
MTTKSKKQGTPKGTSSSNQPTGIEYLSRNVQGKKRMSDNDKVAFAKAMEKGFAVGRRLQLMFDLRDAVDLLRAAKVPPRSMAIEFDQADPVLHLLDEAGDAAKEFIEACGPLLALLPQLEPALDKLDLYLKNNRVIRNQRRSLTDRLLVGLAVARIEEVLGNDLRLEPKEMVEFFKDIDLFDGDGPDADGWKEILWKARHRTDKSGKKVPDKTRGRLLDALELAVTNRAKKD